MGEARAGVWCKFATSRYWRYKNARLFAVKDCIYVWRRTMCGRNLEIDQVVITDKLKNSRMVRNTYRRINLDSTLNYFHIEHGSVSRDAASRDVKRSRPRRGRVVHVARPRRDRDVPLPRPRHRKNVSRPSRGRDVQDRDYIPGM